MAEKYVTLSKVKRKINYVLSVYGNGLVNRKIAEALKKVPVEDVAPVVHGHWIRFKESDTCYVHMRCSACSAYWSDPSHADYFRYCPNCGAKMDTDSEEESEDDVR